MRRSALSAPSSSAIDPRQLAIIAKLWKRSGRELVTRFTGASMEPSIHDGAEVKLLCVDDVKVGDVVAYVYGDRVVVHRLVAQWGDRFVARGDANVLPDPTLLERTDVIGKVDSASPSPKSIVATPLLKLLGLFGARNFMRSVGSLRRARTAFRESGFLRRFRDNRIKSRRFGSIDVVYRPALDGTGSWLAPSFVEAVRVHAGRVGRAFEWCAGPGFVGFALLAADLCDSVCVADINPAAMDCVRETVQRNGLEGRVAFYTSDNFKSIPRTEKFDLVVANPPNYYALNPEHPRYKRFKDDLRPNDRGWKAHEEFYREVGNYLNPGALILVMEIETLNREVFLPGDKVPYDIRPRPPIEDFKRMIAAGGLTYVETGKLVTPFDFNGDLVISRKTA